jgi:enoyl-CoA hydratase/carnithine racemase
MAELVSTRREGHVLVISMQREEKRNAVDRALADAIDTALNTLDDDVDLWVGILTGTPTVFSRKRPNGRRRLSQRARRGVRHRPSRAA